MQINKVKDYAQLSRGELQLIHIREYFLNSTGCPLQAFYFKKTPTSSKNIKRLNWAHFNREFYSSPDFRYDEDGKWYDFTSNHPPQYQTIYLG